MNVDFTFSDTVSGYVTGFDSATGVFGLRTSDGRDYKATLTSMTYARYVFNLDEGYRDATKDMKQLLALSRQYVHVYGTFYPEGEKNCFEAQWMIFSGNGPGNFRHEEPDWWIKQARSIGSSYLKWQFNHPA